MATVAVLGVLAIAPTAEAHGTRDADGLQVVRPEVGKPLLTHGPDPAPPEVERPASPRTVPGAVGFGTGAAERPPICATSENQRVLYARPAGTPDRLPSLYASLQTQVRRMNAALNEASLASGGPTADYRVQCDGAGQITVESFVANRAGFAQIVSDARAAGFRGDASDFLIFFDGDASGCGTGSYADDERLAADNKNNGGGGYAVVYRQCWFSEIPMHEVGHTMGAVQYSSPHSTGSGGHCSQGQDVMCYAPDGGDRNQAMVFQCTGTPRFDCGNDDYFDSAPELGEYLASHWNLGSPLNRFIAFGQGSQVPDVTSAVATLVEKLLGGGRKKGRATGTAGAAGEWRLYELELTRPTRALTVRLNHDAGAPLSLYVRRLRDPTTEEYACKQDSDGDSAICRVGNPKRGRWVAGVTSAVGASGANFEISAALKAQKKRKKRGHR